MTKRRAFRYSDAGVNLRAAETLTERLSSLVDSTRTDEVRGEFGSFGGRFRLEGDPELVASADGVGTKVLVASRTGMHGTVGEDLVNHCVNDILTEGAEPLFFLDYFACGKLDPGIALQVIEGVARGCRQNGCALLGGETAEMPGLYAPGEYDLAGFIVGRVTWDIPGRDGISPGDRLLGLPSSGLHTNGYSLARALLFDRLGLEPEDQFPGLRESVADVLLRVHTSYLRPLRQTCREGRLKGLAHITGGGIPGNLRRVLPEGADAVVHTGAWDPGPVFHLLGEESGLALQDLYEAFNMGVGMIAVVGPADVAAVLASIRDSGTAAFECGEVVAGEGRVVLDRE